MDLSARSPGGWGRSDPGVLTRGFLHIQQGRATDALPCFVYGGKLWVHDGRVQQTGIWIIKVFANTPYLPTVFRSHRFGGRNDL